MRRSCGCADKLIYSLKRRIFRGTQSQWRLQRRALYQNRQSLSNRRDGTGWREFSTSTAQTSNRGYLDDDSKSLEGRWNQKLEEVDYKLENDIEVEDLDNMAQIFSKENARMEMSKMLRILMKHRAVPSRTVFNLMLVTFSKNMMFLEVENTMNYMRTCKAEPNILTFNTLMNFYGRQMMFDMMLELYEQMRMFDVRPDITTYNTMMGAMMRTGQEEQVIDLVKFAEKQGIQPNSSTYNILIQMYSATGNPEQMEAMFDTMIQKGIKPDVNTFAIMLKAHVDMLNIEKLEEVVDMMIDHGVPPNLRTFAMALKACNYTNDSETMIKLFRKMSSHCDTKSFGSMENLLAMGYQYSTQSTDMLEMLNDMIEKGLTPDVETFNRTIKHLATENEYEQALGVYRKMLELKVEPKPTTFLYLMNTVPLAKESVIDEILDEMDKRPEIIANTMIFDNVCRRAVKHQDTELLQRRFSKFADEMGVMPNQEILSNVIQSYAQFSKHDKVIDLYKKIQSKEYRVKPNSNILTWALRSVAEEDIPYIAEVIRDIDQQRDEKKATTLASNVNTILTECYAKRVGKEQESIKDILHHRYQELSYRPDLLFFTSLIKTYTMRMRMACGTEDLDKSLQIRDLLDCTLRTLKLVRELGYNPPPNTLESAAESLQSAMESGMSAEEIEASLEVNDDSENSEMRSLALFIRAINGETDALKTLIVESEDAMQPSKPRDFKSSPKSTIAAQMLTLMQKVLGTLVDKREFDLMETVFAFIRERNLPPSTWCVPILDAIVVDAKNDKKMPSRLTFELQAFLNIELKNLNLPKNSPVKLPLDLNARLDENTQRALVWFFAKGPCFELDENSFDLTAGLNSKNIMGIQTALKTTGHKLWRINGRLDAKTISGLSKFVKDEMPASEKGVSDEPLPSTRKMAEFWEYMKVHHEKYDPDLQHYFKSFEALTEDTSVVSAELFMRLFKELERTRRVNAEAYRQMILYLIKRQSVPRVVKLYRQMKTNGCNPDERLHEVVLDFLAGCKGHSDLFAHAWQDYSNMGGEIKTGVRAKAMRTFADDSRLVAALANKR